MKPQNIFLIFLLLVSAFTISCTKEKVSVNPLPPRSNVPPPPPAVARTLINTQLISVGDLSQSRRDMAVVSAGNKIYIAGGLLSPGIYSSRVDIYDVSTNLWTTAELSRARSGIATAVLNNKIYFAGGELSFSMFSMFSGRVDIYDTQTNSWASADLDDIEALMTGASAGNKVVFASGETAHIYDTSTNIWSTAPLSDRPGSWGPQVSGIAATVIEQKIYFAGGMDYSDVQKAIDIYDPYTNTWSTSTLNEYKGAGAGIAVGNTNYWAGGVTFSYGLSASVEIRNMSTGDISLPNLFQGNSHFSAVQKNDTIVFFTGSGKVKNKFDIYAISSNSWSIGVLRENIEGAAIITVNNTCLLYTSPSPRDS